LSAGEDQRREASLKTVVENLAAVTERTQHIVRDEIELAKAEVAEKVTSLGRGAAVGAAAGVFIALGGLFFLHGVAFFFYWAFFDSNQIFWGYFITAALLFLLAAIGGLLAYKWVKRGAPPVPDQAIAEARLLRESVSATGAEKDAPVAPTTTPDEPQERS